MHSIGYVKTIFLLNPLIILVIFQIRTENLILAEKKILQRINKLISKKAQLYCWTVVDEVAELFRSRGFCSTRSLIRLACKLIFFYMAFLIIYFTIINSFCTYSCEYLFGFFKIISTVN